MFHHILYRTELINFEQTVRQVEHGEEAAADRADLHQRAHRLQQQRKPQKTKNTASAR